MGRDISAGRKVLVALAVCIMVTVGILLFIGITKIEDGSAYDGNGQNGRWQTDGARNCIFHGDLADLIDTLYTDGGTALQRQDNLRNYKNRCVRVRGMVLDVKPEIDGMIPVVLRGAESTYVVDAIVYFGRNDKENLMNVDEYDEIELEGVLDDLSGGSIIITDALFIQNLR